MSKLRRLPCPGVHGPLRGACESSRGLTLPQARSGLRAVSVLPRRTASRRAAPRWGEVHSMFAVRCHGNNPLQTKCIVCTRHATVLLVAPGPGPTRRAFSRHGRNRCRGEEMPPDRTRHDCKFRAWRGSEGPAAPCALRDKSSGQPVHSHGCRECRKGTPVSTRSAPMINGRLKISADCSFCYVDVPARCCYVVNAPAIDTLDESANIVARAYRWIHENYCLGSIPRPVIISRWLILLLYYRFSLERDSRGR